MGKDASQSYGPLEEVGYFHYLLNNAHVPIPPTNCAKGLLDIWVKNLNLPMSVNCSCNVN